MRNVNFGLRLLMRISALIFSNVLIQCDAQHDFECVCVWNETARDRIQLRNEPWNGSSARSIRLPADATMLGGAKICDGAL